MCGTREIPGLLLGIYLTNVASVVFGFSAVTKLQRDKLLERNIPFITDNGQLYLPFLGMMLNNTFKEKRDETR